MINNFSNKIKLYSVIKYNKLHYDAFHDHFFIKNNKSLKIDNGIDLVKKTFNNDFIKTRPAIVISTIDDKILIVPTTTQICTNKTIQKIFRTEIILRNKKSYICWDEINHINNLQITGFWIKNNKLVLLSKSQKRYLKKQSEIKLKNFICIK